MRGANGNVVFRNRGARPEGQRSVHPQPVSSRRTSPDRFAGRSYRCGKSEHRGAFDSSGSLAGRRADAVLAEEKRRPRRHDQVATVGLVGVSVAPTWPSRSASQRADATIVNLDLTIAPRFVEPSYTWAVDDTAAEAAQWG